MSERSPMITAYQGGVGEMHESDSDQVRLARRAVARHVLSDGAPSEVTRDLLAMLGLDDVDADQCCRTCGRAMSRTTGCGRPYPGADGICQPCHRKVGR